IREAPKGSLRDRRSRAGPISHPPSLCYRRSPESGPTRSHTTPSAAELILQPLHEHGGRRPLLALAAEPRFGRRLHEDLFPVTYEGFSPLTRCPYPCLLQAGEGTGNKDLSLKSVFTFIPPSLLPRLGGGLRWGASLLHLIQQSRRVPFLQNFAVPQIHVHATRQARIEASHRAHDVDTLELVSRSVLLKNRRVLYRIFLRSRCSKDVTRVGVPR